MRYTKIIVAFLMACALITIGIVSFYSYRYEQVKENSHLQSIHEAIKQLSFSENEYRNLRDQIFSTISLLSHSSSTYRYVESPSDNTRNQLQLSLASAANGQKWFDSIGFIDAEGRGTVNINYLPSTHKANVLEGVVDVSRSEFFQYLQSLTEDEIGVWAEELSSDIDTFAKPYTPAIQVVTPVSILGIRKGYIVISVDMSILANKLNYVHRTDLSPAIVGDNGYLITGTTTLPFYGDVTNQDHGFDLAKSFPKTWEAMKTSDVQYVMEEMNAIVFKPVDKFFGQNVHLVIRLTPQQLNDRASHELNDLVKEGFFVFMIMLVFALPTVSMSLHYYHRNIESKLARAALDGMTAVMISDKSHQVIMVNGEFETMIGLTSKQVRGHNALKTLLSHNGMEFILNVLEQVDKNNLWEGEVECVTPEGQLLTTIMRIQAIIEANKVSYYITSIVDISERKELENKLRELSEKDSLTHLWNRRKFERELNLQTQLIERYPNDYSACLCLIDIDYFKRVNDEQGHDQGDRVIIKVAQVLSEKLRVTDFLARIGGEEFAVIMPHTSTLEAKVVVERLRLAIELDESLTITISAGISDLSQDSMRSYKCADIALYESKTLGRNQVSLCLTTDEVA
ncbi:diguanylate cyclase [Vibrio ziniensis]|uniref:diguanylate cyclase n=1 Tax=Vibrio ziniensis TaxID=2711221 RepID=A0A6G7CKY6_9VIBR|nr:diguanylate cyclase [Vibrio ziniensis]QIH42762.1 diguanylate cyclase [Vibrio ziniensis]